MWDGQGYPDGIAGHGIPEAARIVALADVFDVLCHQRPYKKAWSVRDALEELRRLKGTRFDPEMTEVFISMVERLSRDIIDLDSFLAQEAKDFPFIQARQKISAALAASAIESNGRSGGNRQSSLLGTRGLPT